MPHTYSDDNPKGTASDLNTIVVSISDDDGGKDSASTSLMVNNVAPVVTITSPADLSLFAINTPISVEASITDPNVNDGQTCTVNWDDETTSLGTITAGVYCRASRSFSSAGVYSMLVTVSDDDTGTDSKLVTVVVYDPSDGYVTGGGWIDSLAGSYAADLTLSGRATFGFVAKYQKTAATPSGNTEFQFQAGSFNFHGDSYDWLVVAGAKAQFKGLGSVNGVSGYSFLLTASDGQGNGAGGVDKFRIKIWNAEGIVYDNRLGSSDDIDTADPQTIVGGSIVIHSGK